MNYEQYDDLLVGNKYVEVTDEGNQVTLGCNEISCAGCVSNIEKKLNALEEVVNARVNFTNKTILVKYTNEIKISEILILLNKNGYGSQPIKLKGSELRAEKTSNSLLYKIGVAAFVAMNMMWMSIAMYSGAGEGEFKNYFELIGLILVTPVMLYSGGEFFGKAWRGLRVGLMNMDLPISIGILITYSYSLYSYLYTNNELYFDTVANFIFIILIGRYIEQRSKRASLSATRELQEMQPLKVLVKKNGKELFEDVGAVNIGDIFIIKEGDIVPLDGVVVNGATSIDESIITGESVPVNKESGSTVLAGSMNVDGLIEVRVSNSHGDSSLQQIIKLVESTKITKGRLEGVIEKVIPYFVLGTIIIGFGTLAYWLPISTEMAILASASVFIITCPCALGLASPLAIGVGAGTSAKHNIMVKNGDGLEQLDISKTVIFDKTGTLTHGDFDISGIFSNLEDKEVISILIALEKHSNHPIAKSLCSKYQTSKDATDIDIKAGSGMSGDVDGVKWHIGSKKYIIEISKTIGDGFVEVDKDVGVCLYGVSNSGNFRIELKDRVKDDAKECIRKIESLGKKVVMLTGDNKMVANMVGKELGIKTIYFEKDPHQKLDIIRKYKEAGGVVMVGDGINDTASLTDANASISFSDASDIAKANSDLVVVGERLMPVYHGIKMSKRMRSKIKQNIFFSILYNITLVPMAVSGNITPLFAAIAMPISSIVVILNSSLLMRKNKK